MKKISLFLIFLLLLSGVLISCSSDGGGSDSDDNETLVTHYSYNLNLELTNSTGEKKTFHKVTEYRCVDNEDTTYSVKNYKIHYFAVENENYTNLSGGGLCELVKKGGVKASGSKNSTYSGKEKLTVTDGSTSRSYLFPSGLKYDTLYYL